MLDSNPGTFAFVQIHHGDNYATTWGNNRATFYHLAAYPTSWFDGTLKRQGAFEYSVYESDYTSRRNTATDVTIQITPEHLSGQNFRFTAHVCLEAGGTGKTVRVYMVHVLDHWPAAASYSRNGFRSAASTQDIALTPGNCQNVVRDFAFDATSWAQRNDIKVIVWAQAPSSAAPAVVYQAAMWQFHDCNNNGEMDEQDLATGYSQDCNSNSIPDECDIAGCTGVNPACRDCNTNGIPDGCEFVLTDCNSNGLADSCEVAAGLTPDCDGNGIPDSCDLAAGTYPDCNENGVPDGCDLDGCQGAPWCSDCNTNGILDYCDVSVEYEALSPQYTPLEWGNNPTFTLTDPPDAIESVVLTFSAVGDLNYGSEYIDVDLNGVSLGPIFVDGFMDCIEQEQTLTVTPAAYNAAKAGGDALIHMVPSESVYGAQCDPTPSWIRVRVEYVGIAASADANSNGIPDECEMAPPVCRGDCNCDGAVGFADIDLFVAGIPNNEAGWLAKYQLFYGVNPPAECWDNADVNGVGTHCGFDDIDPFVKLIPTPCTPRACCFPDQSCQDLIPGQCLIAGGTFTAGPAGDKPCSQTTCP